MEIEKKLHIFFLIIILTLLHNLSWSENILVVPKIDADEYIKKIILKEKPLSNFDIIEISLMFSGVSEKNRDENIKIIKSLIQDFKNKVKPKLLEKEIAEAALTFLHSGIMKKYIEKQTYIDVVLQNGSYNCVSSSVLYVILLKSVNINVWGVKTKDHALCRVRVGDAEFDVETTNEHGFNPGTKKDFYDQFGKITGYNYVTPANYRDRHDITVLELLGLILQNRINDYTEKKKYKDAVELSVNLYTLLKDDESYKNMIITFQNMGLWYNENSLFTQGISFMDKVLEEYSTDSQMLKMRDELIYNYIVDLIDKNELERAESFLIERKKQDKIDSEELKELIVFIIIKRSENLLEESFDLAIKEINDAINIYGNSRRLTEYKHGIINNRIVSLLQKEDLDYAEKIIQELRKNKDIDERKWKEYMVVIYQEQASAIAKKQGNKEAAQYLKKAIETVGYDKQLSDNYDIYLYNYTVNIHNEIASLYNSGKYREAKVILDQALKQKPDSQLLKNDLKLLNKALGEK